MDFFQFWFVWKTSAQRSFSQLWLPFLDLLEIGPFDYLELEIQNGKNKNSAK